MRLRRNSASFVQQQGSQHPNYLSMKLNRNTLASLQILQKKDGKVHMRPHKQHVSTEVVVNWDQNALLAAVYFPLHYFLAQS
mmetsp:Transcript_5486/g.10780  ORF Transcript_5486/g.10780 Transcript_5486/m.10780 type:complete len:82 (-) Transcript_5486:983-1228(-)